MTWSVVKVSRYTRMTGRKVKGYKQTRHARFQEPYPEVTRISQGMKMAEHYPGCGHDDWTAKDERARRAFNKKSEHIANDRDGLL